MVADEIVCKETNILDEIIPQMFKVMQKVAEYSCNYVRRGRLCMQSPFLLSYMLMMIARTVRGLIDPGMIAELESELARVIEDFDRAMNTEVLRSTKKTREYLFLAVVHSQFICRGGGFA